MRRRRWMVVAAAAALVVTAAVWALAQTQLEFREPYLQFKIAYANGFLAGARYVAQQVRSGDVQAATLKDDYFQTDTFKRVVGAMVQQYADRLGQLNKAKQPAPSQ
jgi:hypothetical protein